MIGESFGQYSLIERLGQGGMGVVYKALDRDLRRFVAIKLLPERDSATAELTRRLLREAQTASALNSPQIVTIHHVGREGSRDYIVMEYVEGRTLRAVLDEDESSPATLVDHARQIARALAVAHAAGIVHRDLKPGNVMITRDGLVKVLDFGLAKYDPALAPSDDTGAQTLGEPLTQAGVAMGTPAYMSPEQVQGKPVDGRSDIFSFGAVLYEMFAGAPPFSGANLATLVHQVVYEDPPPLNERAGELPHGIAEIVRRALAKDPAARYASAAEMEMDLAAVAATASDSTISLRLSVPTAVRPGADRGARRWRWHRGMMVATLAVAVLALAWLAAPALRRQLASWQEQVPWQAAVPATELYRRGMALLEQHQDPDQVAAARELFQRAVSQDEDYASAYVGLSEAAWRTYRRERDESHLEQARSYAAHAVELDPQLAAAHVASGLALLDGGDLAAAEAAFRKALQLDPLSARAHRALGRLYQARDEPAAAQGEFRRSLEIAPDMWETHVVLGASLYGQGDYSAASAAFKDAIAAAPDNPVGYRNLGAAEHMLGHFPEAAAALQRALQIQPDQFLYGNLGTLYFFQGLYPQAVAAFEKAVALAPNDHTNWRNLADAYRMLPDRQQDTRQAYLRAAQLARQDLDARPEDLVLRSELALYLARRGDDAEARAELAHLARAGADEPEVHYTALLAWEALGDREQSLAALDRALDAGYSAVEIGADPELVELRQDVRYHRLMAGRSEPGD